MPTTTTTIPDAAAADAERRIAGCLSVLAGLQVAEALAIVTNLTARLIVEPARSPAGVERTTRVVVSTLQASVAMMERDRFGGPVQ